MQGLPLVRTPSQQTADMVYRSGRYGPIIATTGYGLYKSGMAGTLANKAYRGYQNYNRPAPIKPSRRGRPLIKRTPKTLKKQVRQLAKTLKADQATHLYKLEYLTNLTTNAGECAHLLYGAVSSANMNTVASSLRYYNPSTPSTLTTADASTGTYTRQIHYKSAYCGLNIRNNYQVPAKVKVYLCKPKADTSVEVLSYYADGVNDQVISGSTSSTLLSLTDINMVKDAWTVKCVANKLLEAGKEFNVGHTVKDVDFDPSLFDTHPLTYQKRNKSFCFIIRIEGVIGHDTVASERNTMQCGVDIKVRNLFKILYDAGVNLNDISYTDSKSNTWTNTGVVSSKPVADNISYSIL